MENSNPEIKFSNELIQIFENAAILLMLVNSEGRVVNINRAGLEMAGKNKGDVLGILGGEVFNCINAWHEGLPVCGKGKNCGNCAVRTRVNNTFLTGQSYYKEEGILSILHENQIIELNILISTSVISANDEKYVLITIDDTTKLKQQEKKLKDLMNAKDRIFSIIAHDLKSPFYSLIGFSELLIKNLNSYNKEKIENQLKTINKTAKQTYNLLEDLLLWSKSQAGKLNYEPQQISLHQICNEIVAQYKEQAMIKEIDLNYFFEDEIFISADKDMLKTILRNLLSNAIKFTHKGGQINIYTEKDNQNATITVSDNGVGIEKEDLTNFWELSRKIIKTGTTGEKGGGLGLMVCKEFVEKQNGKIWVESEAGKGSDFKFTLPLLLI
jgi:two-component system, sensor histidine kinase and response regulator